MSQPDCRIQSTQDTHRVDDEWEWQAAAGASARVHINHDVRLLPTRRKFNQHTLKGLLLGVDCAQSHYWLLLSTSLSTSRLSISDRITFTFPQALARARRHCHDEVSAWAGRIIWASAGGKVLGNFWGPRSNGSSLIPRAGTAPDPISAASGESRLRKLPKIGF
ncbi:hypothetical protein PENSPDRAFT_740700 [Peniophora sp. CONT]|nr:hypothetical protein PENSPDRAFT_740700 [Peniophora sp. CONT]